MTNRSLSLLLLFFFLLAACGNTTPPPPTPTFTPPPTLPVIASPITVSNAEGTPISEQPGFLEWVLLSGVDEHGLKAEHDLTLLADADPQAAALTQIHTGSPVIVLEIRQVGPQGLQRFYRVKTLDGITGWISDYYVRRQAYVFNSEGKTVPIFDKPRGAEIAQLENITPVTLRQPQDSNWWQVSTLDGSVLGWVEYEFVKESPDKEFLLGEDHTHP
ncbi:MAG TPA: SH3 domain-containing protein [Anaerolineales bacterium]|nr:SH3 domain-containing protein [Anaerolineales bacterium]